MEENIPLELCSNKSKELIYNFKQGKFNNRVEAGRALFQFFGLYTNENEFWDLLDMCINKTEVHPENRIRHINDITRAYYSKIEQLETAGPFSFLGTALAKKEDRLMECAKMHLKLGDIKQYCEIMMSLGQWEKGIALAPCISIKYWQDCVNKYKEVLKKESNEDTLQYELLSNDIESAVKNLIEREEYEDAKVVKILSENEIFFNTEKNYKNIDVKKIHPLNASIETVPSEVKDMILKIGHIEAEKFFANGEVMLSAATELAAGNTMETIITLIRANELFLAYFVAKLLNIPVLDQINLLLGYRAERLKEIDCAIYYYQNCKNLRNIQLFLKRYNIDPNKYGIKVIGDYNKLAKESQGSDCVYYHILAGNYDEAANITIEKTKNVLLKKKYDLLEEVIEMNNLMQNVEISELMRETKVNLLYYGSIIGFFRALWLGFINAILILLKNCSNIENFTKINQGLNLESFEDLAKKVLDGINKTGHNNIIDLIEDIKDPNSKALAKGMIKAIKNEYNSGNLFFLP